MTHKLRSSSLDSSVSSASTTELEARRLAQSRLLELEDSFDNYDEVDDGVPSPKSISAVMDEYVSASIVGRSSYAAGNLLAAVTQFNEALGIELQTELECLYDTNLGFVSGLVRREVDSRIHYDSPSGSNGRNCANILNELGDTYIRASSQSDKHPKKSKWYMQMGAALCIVNEWEKAKQVYKEGINMCKDKKELKAALKNLIKLEQITSTADLPEEDRADWELRSPNSISTASPARSVQSSPSVKSPKIERKHSLIKLRKRAHSMSVAAHPNAADKSRKDSTQHTPEDHPDNHTTVHNLRTYRSESVDNGLMNQDNSTHYTVSRVNSLDMPQSPHSETDHIITNTLQYPPSLLTTSDGLLQLKDMRDNALTMNILNVKKRLSFSGRLLSSISRYNPVPTLSSECKQSWTGCFTPDGCSVASYQSMTTSAVAHMRKLSTEQQKRSARGSLSDDQKDGGQDVSNPQRRMTYTAVQFTSMRIESDDSELDDD